MSIIGSPTQALNAEGNFFSPQQQCAMFIVSDTRPKARCVNEFCQHLIATINDWWCKGEVFPTYTVSPSTCLQPLAPKPQHPRHKHCPQPWHTLTSHLPVCLMWQAAVLSIRVRGFNLLDFAAKTKHARGKWWLGKCLTATTYDVGKKCAKKQRRKKNSASTTKHYTLGKFWSSLATIRAVVHPGTSTLD